MRTGTTEALPGVPGGQRWGEGAGRWRPPARSRPTAPVLVHCSLRSLVGVSREICVERKEIVRAQDKGPNADGSRQVMGEGWHEQRCRLSPMPKETQASTWRGKSEPAGNRMCTCQGSPHHWSVPLDAPELADLCPGVWSWTPGHWCRL